MKTPFNFRPKAGTLPVPAALLITLFLNPLAGKAQAAFTSAGAGQAHGVGGSDMADIVGQLEYNALLALLGAVVLMGIVYLCHVSKACADLSQPQKSIRNLLVLVIGLSSFCSSCSAEQRARAAQYHAEAEYHTCPMNHHKSSDRGPVFNNRYPSNGYSNWYGPTFCKYCGQRISRARQ